jgi:hypothetical protein
VGGAGLERATQANARAAAIVTEAHAWGIDLGTWRAHLNHLSWTEVLRQLALTAGWGPRRCRPAKTVRVYDDFALGEDVIEGENGTLTFRWPSRFQPNPAPGEHTMKEACWKVLAAMVTTEADVKAAKDGIPVREVARRIEEGQYRQAKSAVTVEGSVAGALSRDQLFAYVAPGVYALHVRRLAALARMSLCLLSCFCKLSRVVCACGCARRMASVWKALVWWDTAWCGYRRQWHTGGATESASRQACVCLAPLARRLHTALQVLPRTAPFRGRQGCKRAQGPLGGVAGAPSLPKTAREKQSGSQTTTMTMTRTRMQRRTRCDTQVLCTHAQNTGHALWQGCDFRHSLSAFACLCGPSTCLDPRMRIYQSCTSSQRPSAACWLSSPTSSPDKPVSVGATLRDVQQ